MSEPKIRTDIYYCPECDKHVHPRDVWVDAQGGFRHGRHPVVKMDEEGEVAEV